MKRSKPFWFILLLLMMCGTALMLIQARAHQRLGLPGLKTHRLPDSIRLQADLPEQVLDFTSQQLEPAEVLLKTLPTDTSFGVRQYTAGDGFQIDMTVVLMGKDRTSLHKPQFCLPAQGWRINDSLSTESSIHLERPFAYELPVVKLIATKEALIEGRNVKWNGVYVYWFVCDDGVSASMSGVHRMWSTAKTLLLTGVLQRWAYVSCWTPCLPGQEDATYERISKFISAAVPQFQLVPKPAPNTLTARD